MYHDSAIAASIRRLLVLAGAVVATFTTGIVAVAGQANQPPTAVIATVAGPFRVGFTMSLDGTGSSDPDGTPVVSYSWSLVSKPAASLATLTGSGATRSLTLDAPGSYTVGLTVSDGGLTGSTTRTFATISQAPTAVISAINSAFVAQPLTLDGSASSDPNGDSLFYAWTILSRPAGSVAAIQNATSAAASLSPDRPGTYQIQLVVGDGPLATGGGARPVFILTDTKTVTITTNNTPPGADAGPPQSGGPGAIVTLDGSNSTDVDGDSLTYAWTMPQRPAGSSAALSDPTAVMPTFTVDAPGNYAVELVVRDVNAAFSQADTVTVSTINSAPTAAGGPDQSATSGDLIQLSGQASSDPDGGPLSFAWAFVQVPAGSTAALANSNSVSPQFVVDRPGTFVVRLTVSDPLGTESTDDVFVSTGNSPPVANAGPDQSVAASSVVALAGSGSTDVNGDTLGYAWSFLSKPAGSTAALSADNVTSPTFNLDQPGSYVLQLIVSDAAGGWDTDTVLVTTINSRPVADAGSDQSTVAGTTVTLDGRGSLDADFNPLTYAWAFTAMPQGSVAALSNPAATQPTFVADQPGTYIVQLTVTDGVLRSPADTVSIATSNTAPVADAGADPSRGALGSQVGLDGIGSSDANGHPLTYAWAIISRPAGSVAALTNPGTRTPSFVPDVGGDYVVQLIVNDGFVDSPPDTVVVRVNRPPVADAGADRTSAASTAVVLSGSGTDADTDPLSFAWTLAVPAGSASTLANALTATPSFVPDVSGVYTASLVVNDGFNNSAADDVVVTVTPALRVTPSSTNLLTFESATLIVRASQAAGPGGLAVALASTDAAVASTPASVTIPQGQTSATFDATSGTAAGGAVITASAPGNTAGTATVTVSLRGMTVTLASPTVIVNQTVAGTVTLTQPAPAGGVTVSLGSSNPAAVTVQSPSVAIAAGATSAGFSAYGLGIGAANVLASAPGFAGASAPVTSTMTLTLGPSPFVVERADTQFARLSLSTSALEGGLSVTLSPDDPSRATVPGNVLIPAGQKFTDVAVQGLSEGSTTIRATAGGVQGAALVVTVSPPSTALIDSSPANGERSVAVTRETVLHFTRALAQGSVMTSQVLSARFGGQTLPATVHIAPDRRSVTLFYLQSLPASARVRVTFDTTGIVDELGIPLDGDLDGQPGGLKLIDFDTLTLTTLPGTAVVGRVFASQLGDGGVNTPLADVVISVDGLETTLRTTTDAMGNFALAPAPVGEFFVHIDGRTATNGVPVGAYYPVVGKKWESRAGQVTALSDTFLPLIVPGTLQPVSQTQDTVVAFPPSVVSQDPRLAGVQITIPADSLFSDTGARGGMVGIAPVAADRIPSPLPPGLAFPLVITVQTNGATNFDRPAPVCFPNLPLPETGLRLYPGTRSALWSFNHDIGDWEIVGPMVVSADALTVCTEPGVGIRQPGWHGSLPGVEGVGGEILDGPLVCSAAPGGTTDCLESPSRRPKPGHTVLSDGCGPPGFWNEIIPDGPLLGLDKTFTPACNQHDLDYGIYAPNVIGNKAAADARFLSNMLLACASHPTPTVCNINAAIFYGFVVALGNSVGKYPDGQRAASECDPGCAPFAGLRPPSSAVDPVSTLASAGPLAGRRVGVHHYSIQDLYTGNVVQRGRTVGDGTVLSSVRLRQYGWFDVRVVDPITLETAQARMVSDRPGSRFSLPSLFLGPSSGLDADNDGLTDEVELIVGTRLDSTDTDGDGISDGAEVQQGTNPLDGLAVQTGILATADTPGTAVDVAARNDIAVVADSGSGISVLNVAAGLNPVIVAQVGTPGTAHAVAFEDTLVAVALGPAGLAIVDISDPPAASVVRQLSALILGGGASAVAVAGGTAYVGLTTNTIVAVDLVTGAVIETVSLPSRLGPLQDVAIDRDTLYALTAGLDVINGAPVVGQLHAIPLQSPLQVTSSVPSPEVFRSPGRRFRLFAGGGIAYATHTSGYNTFDLTVPALPSLIAAGSTNQRGWKQIVPNGSGLGIAAVGLNSFEVPADNVSLYDVSSPAQTNVFLTEFDTPGIAAAVSLYNGVAYVADSQSGLQVVNYLASDRNGVPPTIGLESNFPLSGTVGSAEEGKLMRLTAAVDDDVQVRSVEFFINSALVARDGNFPFEHRFITPLIGAAPTLTVRACAIDTGGNQTCTSDVTLTLVQDAAAPLVRLTTPTNGSANQQNMSALTATFSESMDPASVSGSTFQLFSAGPDGQTNTPDDVQVTTGVVSYNAQSATAIMSFPSPLPIENYRAVLGTAVTDLAGIPLAAAYAWTFDVRADKIWISDTSGFWNDPTKWSGGTVPQSGDYVVIDRPAANVVVTVQFNNTASLSQLRSEERIDVKAVLTVQGPATLNGGLTLSGRFSILGDASVSSLDITAANSQLQGTGRITVQGHTALTGGIVSGPALVLGTTTQWTSGAISAIGGGSITNPSGGIWTIDADAILTSTDAVVNRGTIRKVGASTTQLSAPLDHSGVVDIQGGTLTLAGTAGPGSVTGSVIGAPNTVLTFSNYTFGATSSVASQGTVRVSNVDVSGVFTANQLTSWGNGAVFRSAAGPFPTLRLEAWSVEFRDPTPVTVGVLQFEGGYLQGALFTTTINADSVSWNRGGLGTTGFFNGTLNVAGQTTISNTSGVLTGLYGQGTVRLGTQTTFVDGARFSLLNGGTIINPPAGILDFAGTATVTGGGAISTFENLGTLRKSGAGLTSLSNGLEFDNSGLVDLQEGSLYLSGGGTSSGTFASSPATTLRFFGATTLASGSQVQAGGAVEIGGPTIVAGAFSAGSVLLLGSTMDFQNQTPVTLGSLQFEGGYIRGGATTTINAGSVVWNHGGLGPSGSTFQGTLNVSGQTTISNTSGLGVVLFGQGATVRLGTLTTLVDLTGFNMSGTTIINPLGGVMELVRTVTLSVSGTGSAPRIENQGMLRKTGVGLATVNFGLQLNNSGLVDVQQGSLHLLGGGTYTGSVTTAPGTSLRTAGVSFAAASSVAAADTVELSTGTVVDGQFNAATVVGLGSATFNSMPTLSTLTLSGTGANVSLNAPSGLSLSMLDMQAGFLTSVGPLSATNFNWAAGAITGPSLSISGTTNLLPVAGGVARTLTGTTFALGASTVVSSGVVVSRSGSGAVSIVNGATGMVQFNGNVTLCGASATAGSCTFSNAGTLQFGSTPATLTVGSVHAASFINTGSVQLRLGGLTLFDRVVVNGAVTLGGTLDVSTINGFVLSSGDIFSVLTYGSRTGAFGTINGNGETYTPTYGATALTLTKP